MSRAAFQLCFATVVMLSLAVAAPALAALSASAVVSTSSTSSPYDYTIDLHNAGNTNIGGLWFSWDASTDYNFMPASPTNISAPSGWTFPITHPFPGDGYGIEFSNVSGSPIAPGGDGLFHFTSTVSPATMAGPGWFPPNNVTTAWVYVGLPLNDPGFRFDASVSSVPEPMSLVLLTGGAATLLLARRCRRAV